MLEEKNTKRTLVLKEIKGPLDFILSAPSSPPWKIANGARSRVLRLNSGRLVLVTLRFTGTVDEPKVEMETQSETTIDENDEKELVSKVSTILGLKLDLKGFYVFAEKDPVLRQVISHFYGLRGYSEPTVFETIVIAILEQQITLAYARKMRECLIRRFGDELKVKGQVYHAFPSPDVLAKISIDQMRECKLSRYKASYIKGIAESIVKGEFDPEKLRWLSRDDAKERLMKLRGIGRWTSEYILVRGLGKNVVPADDVALRKAVSKFYFGGKTLTGEDVREFVKQWNGYQGVAAFYLLHALRHAK